MFAVHRALCHHVNELLSKRGLPPTAPVDLATICVAAIIVPALVARPLMSYFPSGAGYTVFEIVRGALWTMYMVRLETDLARALRRKKKRPSAG